MPSLYPLSGIAIRKRVGFKLRRFQARRDAMAIRDILNFPDPRLRQPAAVVSVFDSALKSLADDLLDTMRAAPGIGITGPHIGASWRITVLELTPGEVRIYVNPQIICQSDELKAHDEGSISMPGAIETVERPACIRVAYQDIDGVPITEEAAGFLAVCLQHEIDQLDGIFWIHRLSRLKRDRLVKKWINSDVVNCSHELAADERQRPG
jgi:peptide deformylase